MPRMPIYLSEPPRSIDPSRPRNVVVLIDGKTSAFASVSEAFKFLARLYAEEIREIRLLEPREVVSEEAAS
jgi:hypothetical protein